MLKLSGSETVDRLLQPEKAESSIMLIPSEMVIAVRSVQSAKARASNRNDLEGCSLIYDGGWNNYIATVFVVAVGYFCRVGRDNIVINTVGFEMVGPYCFRAAPGYDNYQYFEEYRFHWKLINIDLR